MASKNYRNNRRDRVLRKYANFRRRKSEIHEESCADFPVRRDEFTEITIRDTRTLRTTVILTARWENDGEIQKYARLSQNGEVLRLRPMGAKGIGKLVAALVK